MASLLRLSHHATALVRTQPSQTSEDGLSPAVRRRSAAEGGRSASMSDAKILAMRFRQWRGWAAIGRRDEPAVVPVEGGTAMRPSAAEPADADVRSRAARSRTEDWRIRVDMLVRRHLPLVQFLFDALAWSLAIPVATLARYDFHIGPANEAGIEWAIVLGLAVVSVTLGVLARVEWGRRAAAER